MPAIWALSGYVMALFLAGFRGVPEELREAARMDGATELRVYRHVVFPHLRPVTLAALIILGHISIKVFDLIVAIGGKQVITQVPAVYMWIHIYDAHDYAKGAAIATALLLVDLGARDPVPGLHRPAGAAGVTSTSATTPVVAPVRRLRRRRRAASAPKYLLLLVFAVIVLMPVYVLLVTSFKSVTETDVAHAWSLPGVWTTEAWSTAWTQLEPYLKNSFYLAIPATVLSTVLGSLNGFVLSKWRFPGADVVFTFFLFGMFIPYQAVMIPLAQLFDDIDFPQGIPRLIFAHVVYGIPITALIFRNYYATIPNDLMEAARMDRAGMLRTFWSVVLPISMPAFVVAAIWQFTSIWNDFLFAVFIVTDPVKWPVTVALNNVTGSMVTPYNLQMAAAVLASLPTLVVYVLLGRYFMRGLMAGALKG